jgi:hypothetical protein
MAAVLACGPGAVVSHHQAAWLHDLGRRFPSNIHVTAPARSRCGHPGIKLHRVRDLHPDDVTVVDGIPVTSVVRTLVDQAALLTQQPLRRLFEEAERRGLLDARAVEGVCHRGRGRRGVKAARAALKEAHPDPPMTRSDLERAFLAFCRDSGIPEPSVNVWVEDQEVDIAWLDRGVVVELDSYEYHRTRHAFERDRVRSERLAAARIWPIRVTQHRLTRQAAELRANLLSLLAVSG